jgi:hypothetical protein
LRPCSFHRRSTEAAGCLYYRLFGCSVLVAGSGSGSSKIESNKELKWTRLGFFFYSIDDAVRI